MDEELEGLFARIERDLAAWESKLTQDPRPESSQDALHHLIAVAAAINLGLRDRPSGALASMGMNANTGTDPPASAVMPPSPPTAGPSTPLDPTGAGLTTRLEGIAATLHRLVALIASRIGATGYSIGVSIPAGLSITVEFSLPTTRTASPG